MFKFCATCVHMIRLQDYRLGGEDAAFRGECHAQPPTIKFANRGNVRKSVWPIVSSNDWCGCHKPKDDK